MRTALTRSHALALLAAASSVTAPSVVRAQAMKIRMAAVATESYSEPLYALDGGFFAKAGIEAEMNFFTTGGQITNALAGGALDVGIADPIQVGSGFNRGVPFGFFAGGMEYSTDGPTTQLCVAKNGPIKTVKDLEGKTLGLFGLGSMAEFSTRDWLRAGGVDPVTCKFVEFGPAVMAAAIGRGTIAAGIVSEPNLSAVGDFDVMPFGKVYDMCAKHFYIDCWFANRNWLSANAPLVRKLIGAIRDTARWANAHHDDTAVILAKYSKIEIERIHRMARAIYDPGFDARKLQPPLDIAWRYHALEKQLTAGQLMVGA